MSDDPAAYGFEFTPEQLAIVDQIRQDFMAAAEKYIGKVDAIDIPVKLRLELIEITINKSDQPDAYQAFANQLETES